MSIETKILYLAQQIDCQKFREIVGSIAYQDCPQAIRIAMGFHYHSCTACQMHVDEHTPEKEDGFAPTQELMEAAAKDRPIVHRMFHFEEN